MAITPAEIDRRFEPPKTDDERTELKRHICEQARELGLIILAVVPGSREQSEALSHLEHAVFWVQAGIDRRHITREERKPRVPAAPTEADLEARNAG